MHRLGGDNLTQIERHPYLERMRRKGKKIVFGPSPNRWTLQCYCGNYEEFYKYRGRYYCGFCGRYYKNFKVIKGNVFGVYVDVLDERTRICSDCGKPFAVSTSRSENSCRVCLANHEYEGTDDSTDYKAIANCG